MKRHGLSVAVFVGLVGMGAGLRIALRDLPNFAPVAALALFAGFYFRQRVVAMAAPLCVMVLSDLVIGRYDGRMMVLVYSMLLAPAICGPLLRRSLEKSWWKPAMTFLSCSLGASLAFFAVTNFGSWMWFDIYAKSWEGLLHCYVAALPFFRYTFAGDLFFATLLFGSYSLARLAAADLQRGEYRILS